MQDAIQSLQQILRAGSQCGPLWEAQEETAGQVSRFGAGAELRHLLVGGPPAAPLPRVSPSEVTAFMAAVAAKQNLPQHDVTWERAYSDLRSLSVDSPTGVLAPLESDLGDAPADITPSEQQDAEEGTVLKPKRSPHLPIEEERKPHEISHVPYRSWCPACVAQ